MEDNWKLLKIRQKVEMMEVFTGFETKNRYVISDESGSEKMFAFEESQFISRNFFGSHRPIVIRIVQKNKEEVLTASRKFFWFFPDWEIATPQGALGKIRSRFAWFKRKYDIHDDNGGLQFRCVAKLFSPWTFKVFRNGEQIALVKKRWSGAKEIFTDADNFDIDFMNVENSWMKKMILGLAFAIDADVFESSGSHRH